MSHQFPQNQRKPKKLKARAQTTAPPSTHEFQLPPPLPLEDQPVSYRQLLHQMLQRYQWPAQYTVERSGPQHAERWKASFFLGKTLIGESTLFTSKDAAKENAAMQALGWLNTCGYY